MVPGELASNGSGQRDLFLLMAKTHSAAVDLPDAYDLISFLIAIPNGRYSRGGALPAVVPAAGGGARDLVRLPQLQ